MNSTIKELGQAIALDHINNGLVTCALDSDLFPADIKWACVQLGKKMNKSEEAQLLREYKIALSDLL